MKLDLCQKTRAKEMLLSEVDSFGHLSRKSSESISSSVSLGEQIFVMVNIFS